MMAEAGITACFRGRLGGFTLDAAFTAPGRGVTALFGPSGCGKTTLLRCVAGLQHLADGHLTVGDAVWQDGNSRWPPHRRPVGYVFQEASLFPHLSVKRNLLYGQRRAVRQGAAEAIRFDDVVGLLGLGRLLDRAPLRLSGGERQRVAVARALLSQPRLLLMDEPLSALDRFSKDEILPYFEALHAALSIPVLYVSHDIAEVERLADHLVLLRGGNVIAAGPLAELQVDPALPLVRLRDAGVVLHATVSAYDETYGLSTLSVDGARLVVPGRLGEIGKAHRARIVASDVSLARQPVPDSTILNALPSRIVGTDAPEGAMVNVILRLGEHGDGARLLARITRRSWDTLGLAVGHRVFAQVKSVALLHREL